MAEQNDTNYSPEEIQSAMFAQLVMMFASSAMQQMGKLVDPRAGKAEVNLEAAQMSIDILDMLDAKTHGNLSADEEHMLKEALSSLKLTFVETQAGLGSASAATPPPAEKDALSTPPAGDIKPSGEPIADDKQPRFHKKY